MSNTSPLSAQSQTLLDTIGSERATNLTIMHALRELVFTAAPDAAEEVKYGGLHYSHGRPFCGIFAAKQHVSLEFSRGAEFDDARLLGTGKFRRHLKFTDPSDIDAPTVLAYITKAYKGC